MKMMTIIPVDKPTAFEDVKFTQAEWNAANKVGAVEVPAVTALEAIRQSKGMYRIKGEERPKEVTIGNRSLRDMTNPELKILAAQLGKPIRKKSITRGDLIKTIETALETVEVLDDSEEVQGD